MALRLSTLLDSIVRDPLKKTFTATIDKSWTQGRTAFGGLGAAIAVSCARQHMTADAEAAPLRSVLVSFAGPIAPGEVECEVVTLRRGKSVATIESKIRQGSDCCLSLVASFGAHRATSVSVLPTVEREGTADIPPRESVPELKLDIHDKSPFPQFLQHFDLHWHSGMPLPPTPFQGLRTTVWLRLRDGEVAAKHPTARLLAIADMPPPIVMLHYKVPIMASSLSWSLEFVQPPEEVTSEWFFVDYRLEAAANGYSQQSGTIYDEAGKVVAYSRQCMTYFEPAPGK
jgi:acyl-CoA thioesterase